MHMIPKIVLVIVSIPILFAILMLYSMVPFHNFILYSFANELFSITAAYGDVVVEQKSEIGILQGNGNHCDYYAGLILKSNKDEEEIKKYYTLKYEGFHSIHVTDVNKYLSNSYYYDRYISTTDKLIDEIDNMSLTMNNGEFLYVIYLFKHSMTSRIGDARCM